MKSTSLAVMALLFGVQALETQYHHYADTFGDDTFESLVQRPVDVSYLTILTQCSTMTLVRITSCIKGTIEDPEDTTLTPRED